MALKTLLSRREPFINPGTLHFLGVALVLLVGMHLTMPNVGGTGLVLPFNAWTWLFFALPLGVGLYAIAGAGQTTLSAVHLWLGVGALALTVPVLYPQAEVADALPRLAGIWAGWLWLVMLSQPNLSETHRPWLMLPAIAVLIQTAFGFGQYFFLDPGNVFGYWAENWRPVGVFNQPNVAATFYATGLAISGYGVIRYGGYLQSKRPARRGWAVLQTGTIYLLPLITVPLIIVLGSRTGWLAAIGVVICISAYALHMQHRAGLLKWWISVLGGIALGWLMLTIQPEAESRTAAKANLDTPRWVMYRQAGDLIQEAPFIGHGLGRFEPAQVETAASIRDANPDYPPVIPATTHPHNEFLYVWSEGGLLAVSGLVLMVIAGVIVLWRLPPGRRLVSVALILPIVLHTQTELPLYISSIHWLALVLFLAIILRDAEFQRLFTMDLRPAVSRSVRLASLVVPVILVYFMATTLHTNRVLNEFQRQIYRDLSDLDAVSNTFVWRDRIDWLRFNSALVIGMDTNNSEYVRAFTIWADEALDRLPRPGVFRHQIAAFDWLGAPLKARDLKISAKRLYPDKSFEFIDKPELATEISASVSAYLER